MRKQVFVTLIAVSALALMLTQVLAAQEPQRPALAPANSTLSMVTNIHGLELVSQIGGEVNAVAFSPDGARIALGCPYGVIKLRDVVTGKESFSLSGHRHAVLSLSFSPDGKMLASASDDNFMILWDVSTLRAGSTSIPQPSGEALKGHTGGVTSAVFSPDGRDLASVSDDHTIRVWEAKSGQEISRFTYDQGANVAAFSPDGKTLASGSYDKTLRLWDVSTGTSLRAFEGHKNPVLSVAFSPDGKTLASGSADRTLILWNVATRQPLATPLTGHQGWVLSVAFSPDGNTLASGSADRTLILWEVDPAAWQRMLCAKLPRNLNRNEWVNYVAENFAYQVQCPDLPVPTN